VYGQDPLYLCRITTRTVWLFTASDSSQFTTRVSVSTFGAGIMLTSTLKSAVTHLQVGMSQQISDWELRWSSG
jgi:hypothetical protein